MTKGGTGIRIAGVAGKVVLGALLPVALLLGWQVASGHSTVIPSVAQTLAVLAHPFDEPAALDSAPLAMGILVSVLRVFCGFALAALTAIPVGLLLGRSRIAQRLLGPSLSFGMVISPIAWMLVAIVVFGFASVGKVAYGDDAWRAGLPEILDQLTFAVIAVVWYGAFMPIAFNTAAGAKSIRESHLEAAKMLGAGRWKQLTAVILPGAAPAMTTGLRIGGVIAWRAIVAAELFPGTRSGLGYMIQTSYQEGQYEYGFAAILAIGVVGLILDGGLRLLEWRVGRWRVKER